ncbi:hypothetical protein THARTR1_03948 [Trichoderma harzianum]|uniref:Uncharacterized protein n=1 Tax=Trichoderma harzianum TaxID=5544 RepID=A0A2K0UE02_TRIHA|nr:hypothetical protein THARTR1_03948 [Trichoderma harzianum]
MEPTSDVEGIEVAEPRKTALSQSKTDGEDPERQESPNSAATEQQHQRTAAQVQEEGSASPYQTAIARKAAEDQAASGPAPAKDIYDFPSDIDSQESTQVDITTWTGPPTTPPPSSNTTKPAPKPATKRPRKRPAQRRKEPLILPPDIPLPSALKRRASSITTSSPSKRVRFLDHDDAAPQTTIEARYSAMEDFFRNLSSGATKQAPSTQVPVACVNAAVIRRQAKEMLELSKQVNFVTQMAASCMKKFNEFMSNLERSLKAHCDKETL